MSLNATTGSWITVATLQDIQASSLTQESFHGLKQITASSNPTSSTANLYGIELNQEATNDEQSTSSDVSSTSGTALALDQLYFGTISSRHPDTVDTDLYKINVVAGQTYILGFSYDGNVVGWNAQSYNSTDDRYNYNFNPKYTLSNTDGTTITTTYLQSFSSGSFYSFAADATGTLSLLVEPSSTRTSGTDQQDYGLFVKSVDTDGMESLLRGAFIGSVFSDDVTLHLSELDALDGNLYQTHLLSGNDQVLVDFQNARYLHSTVYLDEGNDTLSVTNDQKFDMTDSFNAITAYGGTGDDSLSGGRGNDLLIGGSGDDILNGGDGNDTLKGDCYNGDLSYCSYEDSDRSGGVDTINGGAGKDIIVGSVGADLVTGGADEDLFVFEVKEDFGDIITDFEVGIDKIALFDALETSNLTGKTFKDVVNLVQSGDDTIVQMSLNATTGSWITVATLQDIQASSLTQESFHGLDKIGTIVDPIVDEGFKPISLAQMLTSDYIFTDTTGIQSKGMVTALAPTNTLILSAELEETTDGAVDISDVISQLRHIVELSELIGLHKAAADNDANGTIDISDVISSLRQIVGLQDSPNARVVDAEGNQQFMFNQSVADLYLVAPGDVDLSWAPLDMI
jgi:Ca2+-binding RTX toxin-like protein